MKVHSRSRLATQQLLGKEVSVYCILYIHGDLQRAQTCSEDMLISAVVMATLDVPNDRGVCSLKRPWHQATKVLGPPDTQCTRASSNLNLHLSRSANRSFCQNLISKTDHCSSSEPSAHSTSSVSVPPRKFAKLVVAASLFLLRFVVDSVRL